MKRAYTIGEFDERYGLGRTKTYQELKEGHLKAVRVGAKRLIRHDDAEAWLASLTDSNTENAA